jgi:hypothetical protein
MDERLARIGRVKQALEGQTAGIGDRIAPVIEAIFVRG